MKQIFKFLFAATFMVAISISSNAQTSATANGNAAAVIICSDYAYCGYHTSFWRCL